MFLLRRFLVLGLAYLPCAAFAQTPITLTSAGGSFTIQANSYTSSATALSGGADFFANGVAGDYMVRDMWAYRQSGDTREYMLTDPSASFSSTGTTFDAVLFRGVNGAGPATLKFDVHYTLGALSPTVPILYRCVRVTNISTQTINVSLFHYEDLDIPGGGNDAIGFHNPGPPVDDVMLYDTVTPGNFAHTRFGGFGGTLSIQHGPVYGSLFTNSTIDNLNNVAAGGSGNFALGFQFDMTLAPGQQSGCLECSTALNGVVPEPLTMVPVGLGLVGLILRKRRRQSM